MRRFLFLTAWLSCATVGAQAASGTAIAWRGFGDDVFVQARAQQRFVLLDLEALWCHWCHVMDQTTYQDPRVIQLLAQQYIPVRVDQDADPALTARYQDYGWPATIVLAADGTEIVKRRGYLSPTVMASMLAAIIKDPSPGPSVLEQPPVHPARSALLDPSARRALRTTYYASYDAQYAGWGHEQKFIDADSLDYALAHSKDAPAQAAMARATLGAATALIDPVWGGVYQYSDQRDWKSPHFEKIMSFQTQYVRLYAQGYRVLGDAAFLQAAQRIDRYVRDFLTSPQGVVYVSQDADVDARLGGHEFYAMGDPSGAGRHSRVSTLTSTRARTAGKSLLWLRSMMRAGTRTILRARAARPPGSSPIGRRVQADSATTRARQVPPCWAIRSPWGRLCWRSTPPRANATI